MNSIAKRNKPWVMYSALEVPKRYTRTQIARLWQGGRVKFFFAWSSGNVYVGSHPENPLDTFEEILGLRQILNRSHEQQQARTA